LCCATVKAKRVRTGFAQPNCIFATRAASVRGGRWFGPVKRLVEAHVRSQQQHPIPTTARGMTSDVGVDDSNRTDALALTDLRIRDSHGLSSLREGGLKFTLGLAAGTHSVELRILLDTADQTAIYAVRLATSGEPGFCPVILEVRELSAGGYILEATPCGADGESGTPTQHRFAVIG
jgi:hypothetical protein